MSSIPQPTCLFTGAPLSAVTREEHTIPRVLGGRIRSRVVSSDQFNNDCGSFLDAHLALPYSRILNRLEPLMAGEHSQAALRVTVPGEPDGIVLEAGGIPTRRGKTIVSRDPVTDRPTAAVSANEAGLRQLASQLGREESLRLSTVPVTQSNTFLHRAPVILAELEIAALKCGLLTFDHFLQATGDAFTRSDSLLDVRRFIAEAVSSRTINGELCHRHSLGLQYERLEMYRRLRLQLGIAESPFEHVLLVASHTPSRCLDLVWIVFGFDPFGFRLSYNWRGPDVHLAIVNSVLSGGTASMPTAFVPEDAPLCGPTLRRAFPSELPVGEEVDRILREVALRRDEAFQRAVLLLEQRADTLIRENFIEAAMLVPAGARGMQRLVTQRLCNMYGRRRDDAVLIQSAEDTVARFLPELNPEFRDQQIPDEQAAASVAWDAWLPFYRQCLAAMVDSQGLPGDPFTNATESGIERADVRRLGELPGRE